MYVLQLGSKEDTEQSIMRPIMISQFHSAVNDMGQW